MNLRINVWQVPIHRLPRCARTLFTDKLESLYDIFTKSNPAGKSKDDKILGNKVILENTLLPTPDPVSENTPE